MYSLIQKHCDQLVMQFGSIPNSRKELLEMIAAYITNKFKENKPVNLIYICTHNSRRSHFGQVWSKVASVYYKIPNVNTYSGGTESTAFNHNAINALKKMGFITQSLNSDKNPTWLVSYSDTEKPIECFSKTYDDPKNPQKEFAAVMTCSEAEENCPFIFGAELRIGTTYNDPKAFDNTSLQDKMYEERCSQIALETLYVFSRVKK